MVKSFFLIGCPATREGKVKQCDHALKIDISSRLKELALKMMLITMPFEPRHEKTCLRGLATRVDSNQPAQPQKLGRGLKFQI